ncbi:hypothetical protein AGMMS49941_11860 [Deferribacterales bacterium]|nr:hypothetical protein AGMMS49941_11860 [Deferribacterales bacterium]
MEHQSTVNPNMPLRFLEYIARLYETILSEKPIYTTRIVEIPTPEFIVLYNGATYMPDEKILKLSDMFNV